jgi:hypothetical protein
MNEPAGHRISRSSMKDDVLAFQNVEGFGGVAVDVHRRAEVGGLGGFQKCERAVGVAGCRLYRHKEPTQVDRSTLARPQDERHVGHTDSFIHSAAPTPTDCPFWRGPPQSAGVILACRSVRGCAEPIADSRAQQRPCPAPGGAWFSVRSDPSSARCSRKLHPPRTACRGRGKQRLGARCLPRKLRGRPR